ncbi:DUF3253 domain-containing protein [Pedobacter jeongneungensis]|uniref:DUF3253 domain-containing protein n=1 Tax=Pedobacter jeongneungensis TaxID=947309 RepID=UPI000A8B83CD|nr:DUF3253 domain-containing protein [Pedobacter jeongneungensis]
MAHLCYFQENMQDPKNIASTILSTAIQRGPEKTTCPSEIARMLFPGDWRNHMKEVRDVAIDLHKQGKVVMTQKGIPVDVDHIKGPVRIKIILFDKSKT